MDCQERRLVSLDPTCINAVTHGFPNTFLVIIRITEQANVDELHTPLTIKQLATYRSLSITARYLRRFPYL